GSVSYRLYVVCSDGSLTDSETITVTVSEANTAPVLGVIGNKSVAEQTLLSFTATATDADLPANTLTYSLVGAPAGAGITASGGGFTWTPTQAQGPGSYTFDVGVSDGSPTHSETNTPPPTPPPPPPHPPPPARFPSTTRFPSQTLLSFPATATDADLPANTLTYSLVGAPAGAGITASGGVFTWTPTEAQGPGSYTFDVVVSDGSLTD